jgi:hypothetical protein
MKTITKLSRWCNQLLQDQTIPMKRWRQSKLRKKSRGKTRCSWQTWSIRWLWTWVWRRIFPNKIPQFLCRLPSLNISSEVWSKTSRQRTRTNLENYSKSIQQDVTKSDKNKKVQKKDPMFQIAVSIPKTLISKPFLCEESKWTRQPKVVQTSTPSKDSTLCQKWCTLKIYSNEVEQLSRVVALRFFLVR